MKARDTLALPAFPSALLEVLDLRGREGLGRPYELDLVVPARGRTPVPGEAALLERTLAGEVIARRFGILAEREDWTDPAGGARWTLRLVPRLWRLSLGCRSRAFADRTLVQVMGEILREAGLTTLDFAFRLEEGPWTEVRPLVCQVRESDLDFLRRWCGRTGVTYVFEQGERRERVVFQAAARLPGEEPRPWPRVEGVALGRILAPEGEGRGDQGRHRVRLPFDGTGRAPVRVPLAVAGSGPGPRLPEGAAALLAFEEGDPDRPVILGVLPSLPLDPQDLDQPFLRGDGGGLLAFGDRTGEEALSLSGPGGKATLGLGGSGWDLRARGSAFHASGLLSDQAEGSRLEADLGATCLLGGLLETDTSLVHRTDLSLASTLEVAGGDTWHWGRQESTAGHSRWVGGRFERVRSSAWRSFGHPLALAGGVLAPTLAALAGLLEWGAFPLREAAIPAFSATFHGAFALLRRGVLAGRRDGAPEALLRVDGSGLTLGCRGPRAGHFVLGGGDLHTRLHVLPDALALEQGDEGLVRLATDVEGRGSLAMMARSGGVAGRRGAAALLMTQGGEIRDRTLGGMVLPRGRLRTRERKEAEEARALAGDRRAPGGPGLPPELAGHIQSFLPEDLDGLPCPPTLVRPGGEGGLDLWAGTQVHLRMDGEGLRASLQRHGGHGTILALEAALSVTVPGVRAEAGPEPSLVLDLSGEGVRIGCAAGGDLESGLVLGRDGLRLLRCGRMISRLGDMRIAAPPGRSLVLDAPGS